MDLSFTAAVILFFNSNVIFFRPFTTLATDVSKTASTILLRAQIFSKWFRKVFDNCAVMIR